MKKYMWGHSKYPPKNTIVVIINKQIGVRAADGH
jgi:hypothetical protein